MFLPSGTLLSILLSGLLLYEGCEADRLHKSDNTRGLAGRGTKRQLRGATSTVVVPDVQDSSYLTATPHSAHGQGIYTDSDGTIEEKDNDNQTQVSLANTKTTSGSDKERDEVMGRSLQPIEGASNKRQSTIPHSSVKGDSVDSVPDAVVGEVSVGALSGQAQQHDNDTNSFDQTVDGHYTSAQDREDSLSTETFTNSPVENVDGNEQFGGNLEEDYYVDLWNSSWVSDVYENYSSVTMTPVRKCCGLGQYFNLESQDCETTELSDTGFEDAVRSLMLPEHAHLPLEYVTGRLQHCPGSGFPPVAAAAHQDTHTLLPPGQLYDYLAEVSYDHDHHCLELAAQGSDQLSASPTLVTAYCHPWPSEIVARKCCELDEYYDHGAHECRPRLAQMSDHDSLVREFFRSDPKVASIKVSTGRLRCDRGNTKTVVADEAFLDANNELCERQTGECHSLSHYCVEYMWTEGDTVTTPVATVCPIDHFNKCCYLGYVLTDNGCQPKPTHGGVLGSAKMKQVLEMLDAHVGFPTGSDGDHYCQQQFITHNDTDLRWWISKDGHLSVKTREDNFETEEYCVDDFLDAGNETQAVAILCSRDLARITHVPLTSHQEGIVGKCCPHGRYFDRESNTCILDEIGLDLRTDPQLQSSNISDLVFTDFPQCQTSYHYYPVGPSTQEDDDLANISPEQILEVVSLDGACVLTSTSFPRNAYCVEYMVNSSRLATPMVMVCSEAWDANAVHTEKELIMVVLYGISSAALLATAFSLISARVRRGMVTVKRVNTLAGRILLSYVLTSLVSNVLLAVGNNVVVQQENTECLVIAGLHLFTVLSSFLWNTSICLEPLLLTLQVSLSERPRFLLHSLWGWGIPGLITLLAFILDAHRHSLPCGVITPKFGLYRCSISDQAMWVYLYLPMLLTLLANIALLVAARYVRTVKLQRLELGKKKNTTEMQQNNKSNSEVKDSSNNNSSNGGAATGGSGQTSGLRTHQTRNLKSESVKLVIWSGGTWIIQVIGFIIQEFAVTSTESWYDYLWYLPSIINSLRGVGIFFILVFTPENRTKMRKTLVSLGSKAGSSGALGKSLRSTADGCSTATTDHRNHSSSSLVSEVRRGGGGGRRNMSIATTITQLSSIRSSQVNDSRSDTSRDGPARVPPSEHPSLAHSISQVETRRSSVSSQSSEFEGYELDSEAFGGVVAGGGRRKTSMAGFGGVVSLPSVDEDPFEDNTAHSVCSRTSDA